jgi:hypothetical protein
MYALCCAPGAWFCWRSPARRHRATAKINDGDTSTNHTEWVQLNLGASHTIYKVDLYPRNDPGAVGQGFPVDFTIQVTNDATCFVDWVTVVTRVDYPTPGDAGQSFNFTAPTR